MSQAPQQPQEVTPDQAIAIAIDHYNANRFAETEAICRKVLAAFPNHLEATHVLGLVAHRVGRNDIAAQLLSHVAAHLPDRADVRNNLGEAFRGLGRADDAIAAYRAALAIHPQMREAYNK